MDIERRQEPRKTEISRQTPEPEVQAILTDVRQYIKRLAIQTQDHDLKAINVDELSEEDIVLLRRFMIGELTLAEIKRQESVLMNIKDAISTIRLLAYMKKKLTGNSSIPPLQIGFGFGKGRPKKVKTQRWG